jgi:hypothetical protein
MKITWAGNGVIIPRHLRMFYILNMFRSPWCLAVRLLLSTSILRLICIIFLATHFVREGTHHPQPMNVPTAGAQAFLMDFT